MWAVFPVAWAAFPVVWAAFPVFVLISDLFGLSSICTKLYSYVGKTQFLEISCFGESVALAFRVQFSGFLIVWIIKFVSCVAVQLHVNIITLLIEGV